MAAPTDYSAARQNMVEGQIRPNKVTDAAVVDAFLDVPRELFLPKSLRGIAYIDEDIHLGDGRYVMEPMVCARLVHEAAIRPSDVVLVVGCATGYAAAIAGRLAATVMALESDPALAVEATRVLQDIGSDNVIVVTGPLAEGWPAQQPYGAIVVDGAIAGVPKTLFDQLADGGRLVAVIDRGGPIGDAKLFRRVGDVVSGRTLFEAAVRPLPGFAPAPAFEF